MRAGGIPVPICVVKDDEIVYYGYDLELAMRYALERSGSTGIKTKILDVDSPRWKELTEMAKKQGKIDAQNGKLFK